jgi:hypothetical protein
MKIGPDEETAEDVIDALMPDEFDWERLVRDYPLPALALAGLGGFALGRQRGFSLLGALALFSSQQVIEIVNDSLGSKVL